MCCPVVVKQIKINLVLNYFVAAKSPPTNAAALAPNVCVRPLIVWLGGGSCDSAVCQVPFKQRC